MTVKIEVGTVIGFDGERHRIIRDGVVVFDEEQIIHVGKSYQGVVDEVVDAKEKLVTPGSSTPTATPTPPSPSTTSQSTSPSTPSTSMRGSGGT